jgi:dolichyl-diphosphooligosaccharide---protein glycosyltransferase
VAILCLCFLVGITRFAPHCWHLGRALSEPQIMLRGKNKDGERVIIDDFREAYWWLRDRTPEDARVMAWWDYGYQINGVANRTTIADGNTWNHEHIALLGKCLVSSENDSHAIIRHLADYVLIWTTRYAGMYSDDLAKSPHMARIAGSVYDDVKPKEFYLDQQGNPSDMMAASILWRMHGFRYDPRVKHFHNYEEAYTTSNKMVRIYRVLRVSKKSKDWRAAQGIKCSQRECYPPALQPFLQQKRSFKQIHGILHA